MTVSALIANGQTGQITYRLGRATDNGLTQKQNSEVLTQIAFYAGWPCAFSALPVVKEVFECGEDESKGRVQMDGGAVQDTQGRGSVPNPTSRQTLEWAAPNSPMIRVTIQDNLNGNTVD